MRRVAFFVGYGLLPFWGAVLVVLIGSLFSRSYGYWAVAPWLIIVSIPVCGATLLVAVSTVVIHARADGDKARKLKVATTFFWGLNLVIVSIAGFWWLQSATLKRDVENEKKLALEFVASHGAVVQQFGRDVGISLSSYTGGTDALPLKYEFAIDTRIQQGTNPNTRYVFAIVRVTDSSGQRQFVLDCITRTSLGHRDPFKDPCKQ